MSMSEIGEDIRDNRMIFRNGPLIAEAFVLADEDGYVKMTDADCYSAADIQAFKRGDWEYVGILVRVSFDGVEIAYDSLWGIESGQLDEVTADPWEWTPADVSTPGTIIGGSQLWDVATQAVDGAQKWLEGLVGRPAAVSGLDTMIRWVAATGNPDRLGDDEIVEFTTNL